MVAVELPGDALFTRIVSPAPRSYEVLREELPHLVKQSANDGKLGCLTAPLSFDTAGSLTPAIASLREDAASEDRWLPKLLGRDLAEEASPRPPTAASLLIRAASFDHLGWPRLVASRKPLSLS